MHNPPPVTRILFALCLFAGTALAHGGQYRGPQAGGSSSPPARGPRGGSAAAGPTTGGNRAPDINSWQVWWQLNHERYINTGTTTVTNGDRRAIVMPTLALALNRNNSPRILSASLIALGKSAVEHPDMDALKQLREHLSNASFEVREAGTIAMGLSGRADAVADLSGLLANSRVGRALVSRTSVDGRVRAFACSCSDRRARVRL